MPLPFCPPPKPSFFPHKLIFSLIIIATCMSNLLSLSGIAHRYMCTGLTS